MKKININSVIVFILVIVVFSIYSCNKDEIIEPNALPEANFTLNPESPKKEVSVTFTDASTDEDGSIKSWLWNFGDGTVSQEQNPTHTFAHATIYKVRLTVKDNKGGENTIEKKIIVSDLLANNVLPTASFTASSEIVQKGAEITFTDNSTDSDGIIDSWSWDFGDGNTSTSKSPNYFYNDIGEFTVTLTVTDNLGGEAIQSKEISIWGTKWSYAVGSAIKNGTPAIANDGTVYIGSDDDNLYAINPDGTLKWTYLTGGNVRNSASIGADGTIYIGSDDDNLYALNPDGTEKWRFAAGGNVNLTTNAIGSDGTIYIGSSSDKVFAVNPDGTEKWNYVVDGDILSLALTGNMLYFTHNGSRKLISLDVSGSTPIQNWAFTHGAFTAGSMAIDDDNTVYFQGDLGGGSGKIWAIKSDGTEKWSFSLSGSASRGGVVLAQDGTLYAATKEATDHFRAINSVDGSLKWTFTTGGKLSSAPVVDSDGNVYIGSEDDTFYVLDSSGNVKFEFPTGGNIWSPATIGPNGIVYFGSYDKNLYAMKFTAKGLDTGAWPKTGKDLKNTTNK